VVETLRCSLRQFFESAATQGITAGAVSQQHRVGRIVGSQRAAKHSARTRHRGASPFFI
jgi:hypothetical protein